MLESNKNMEVDKDMTLKRRVFHTRGLCRGLLLSVLALFLWVLPADAAEDVVAKVNGSVLTELDLEEELDKIVPRAVFHGAMNPEKRNRYRPEALEKMIEDELLYQEAKRMGLKADKKRIKETRKSVIKKLGGKKAFKATLKRKKMTERQYRKKLEKLFLVDMITEKEINEKSKVSDEEVAEYYEKNRKRYVMPEARRVWHVLIKVDPASSHEVREGKRKQAAEVLEKARGAEDLGKLAWDYSDGPYRVKSGDLGYLHEGRLESPLNEVAFGLGKGEMSGVTESIYGYHIVKVLDIKEPTQLGLEDVAQKIRKQMEEQRLKETRKGLISALRAKADIEISQ
jgi:parvulin-like peptidyl-prolyl isomerase